MLTSFLSSKNLRPILEYVMEYILDKTNGKFIFLLGIFCSLTTLCFLIYSYGLISSKYFDDISLLFKVFIGILFVSPLYLILSTGLLIVCVLLWCLILLPEAIISFRRSC